MTWMRSSCIRGMDGLLRCPDDQDGLSTMELDRENAMGALEPSSRRLPGGSDW